MQEAYPLLLGALCCFHAHPALIWLWDNVYASATAPPHPVPAALRLRVQPRRH